MVPPSRTRINGDEWKGGELLYLHDDPQRPRRQVTVRRPTAAAQMRRELISGHRSADDTNVASNGRSRSAHSQAARQVTVRFLWPNVSARRVHGVCEGANVGAVHIRASETLLANDLCT